MMFPANKFRRFQPKDWPLVLMRFLKRRVTNKLPSRVYPFVLRRFDANGIRLDLMTHSHDFAYGGMLRGEHRKDLSLLGELNVLQSKVRPNSVIVDAGANVGVVSIFLAKLEPTATIYSYEPAPLNYSLLNMNLNLNKVGNVSAHNFALGLDNEYIEMHLHNMHYGDHRSYAPSNNEHTNFTLTSSVLKVNVADHLKAIDPRKEDVTVDILKIDTQGTDFEILESCLPLLRPGSVVSIEFSPFHLSSFGADMNQVTPLLSRFDKIQRILPAHQSPRLTDVTLNALVDLFETHRSPHMDYDQLLLTF